MRVSLEVHKLETIIIFFTKLSDLKIKLLWGGAFGERKGLTDMLHLEEFILEKDITQKNKTYVATRTYLF